MVSFDVEYKKLNRKQQQAVDAIDGPVMVIAGPGTGKTQLLASRVANILKKTDVYPDNILCLTFTNKAADNMSQRLLTLIGKDARNVTIKTFHSLAADIMNRYPEYFWRGSRLSLAPDAILIDVVQQVLYSLPADNGLSLKFAGQYALINDVSDAIKLAKEAGLTPAKLRTLITSNLKYIDQVDSKLGKLGQIKVAKSSLDKIHKIVDSLPDQLIDTPEEAFTPLSQILKTSYEKALDEANKLGKTSPISRWKQRWVQKTEKGHSLLKERERNNWWLDLADAYAKYRALLHKRGYYDYADMLVEVISQIEQHDSLRASLQEQFLYILIDEFQDTNSAQIRLAHLIADHPDLEQPNIMTVGDDDQSIFKFQGAELSNMLGFAKLYQDAKIIVLTGNYRSTQAVLNVAEKIISNSSYRLVNSLPNLTKKLIARSVNLPKGIVEHQAYISKEQQLADIADQAIKNFRAGKSVAILARSHDSLRDIANIVSQKGAPIAYEQSANILEQPAIEQFYCVMKIISSIKQGQVSETNELLSLTLAHPMWKINPKTLWRFAIDQQTKHDWYSGLLESKDKRLLNAGKWLTDLVQLSSNEPLPVIIEYALGLRNNYSPINEHYLNSDVTEENIRTLSAIKILRSLVSEFRPYGSPKIEDFVDFIDLIKQNNKVISDQSTYISADNHIELLTVHKAKGLEFDSVFIIDAVEQVWSPNARGRVPPANLPLRPAEDDQDDYVRLMYVGATRARYNLIFSSYAINLKGEAVLPAYSLANIPISNKPAASHKKLEDILEQSLRWPKLSTLDEKILLRPRLSDYSLNVSNLINFLDLTKGGPQYFKERNLLLLPQAKTPAAAMGSAIHSALEEAQLLVNASKFNLSKVIERFESSLLAEGLAESDYKKKLAEGSRAIRIFIKEHHWEFAKGGLPEYKIVDTYLNNARLSGAFDVLNSSEEKITITDYKTGRALKSLALKSGDAAVKAWRHKLQLVFYALLAELNPAIKVKNQLTCQLVYVQAAKKTELVIQYQPSSEELTELGTLVQVVWNKIMSLDFPDISGYSPDIAGITKFQQDLISERTK